MTPLPENPRVLVLLLDPDGPEQDKVSTNVSPKLIVEIVESKRLYEKLKQGLPFQDIDTDFV